MQGSGAIDVGGIHARAKADQELHRCVVPEKTNKQINQSKHSRARQDWPRAAPLCGAWNSQKSRKFRSPSPGILFTVESQERGDFWGIVPVHGGPEKGGVVVDVEVHRVDVGA